MNLFIYILFIFSGISSSKGFFMYNAFFRMYRKMRIHHKNNQYKIKNIPRIDKLIISTPGGLNGFYLLGVSSYLKENYNLTDYLYSGASAGAWNSLFLSFRGNDTEFINNLLCSDIHNATSVVEIENIMKNMILTNYCYEDFELEKVNIGVTVCRWFLRFKIVIYKDFLNLKDAVFCCMASSHIPFITGGLLYFYRKKCCFDGGFFSKPYLNMTPTFTISPDMWNSTHTYTNFIDNALQMNKLNVNLTDLYIQGYNDTKNNKQKLDDIFL